VLAHSLEFIPERDAEIFTAVPAAPAVFLLRATDPQAEPYVGKTANLRRRLIRLLAATEERTRKLNLRDRVRAIEFTSTGSDFESGFLLYQALRKAFPKTYGNRLRLRFAPLVKMHMENAYPRASITNRMGREYSNYYGPFPSRAAAEKFANDSLDFFKMRRCVDDLNPDPAFPGCIYSEMKMCLAPCFKGCTDEEYASEVSRVRSFLDSRGDALVREISAEREQASSELRFEDAAALHARLEKLKPVLAQAPEIVHRLDRLNGVIIQRSAQTEAVALFRIDAGAISGPITFSVQQELVPGGKTPSMEARIAHALEQNPAQPVGNALRLMEHLAILKRWYFRSSRLGEIFLADAKGELPWRRIVRGIGRVYKGEQAEPEMPATGALPLME
jgi:excinuclease UvrABC nuclease subunit